MSEEGVLDNPFRKLIYQYIVEHPGTSFKFMVSAFNVPPGTLRYHLLKLEGSNIINNERTGNKSRYFSSFHRSNNYDVSILELPKKQRILFDFIKNNPGLRTNAIANRTGMRRKELYYNLRKLREMKLVWRTKGGGYESLSKDDLKKEITYMLIDRFLEGKINRERFDSLVNKLEEL